MMRKMSGEQKEQGRHGVDGRWLFVSTGRSSHCGHFRSRANGRRGCREGGEGAEGLDGRARAGTGCGAVPERCLREGLDGGTKREGSVD